MRFLAPARGDLDAAAFARGPLRAWAAFADLLQGSEFPSVAEIDAHRPDGTPWRFVAQTPQLLADGLHYEERIAARGEIATREANWHDLFNALIWLRHAPLKQALNARQAAEIAHMGPKRRSRAQCALTHFDEAGAVVVLRDPGLLPLWDAHDWEGLFWRERAAWHDGRIALTVFGHALLEHALSPAQLLCAKTLVMVAQDGLRAPSSSPPLAPYSPSLPPSVALVDEERFARAIGQGALLGDPQDLRPLPLSGIPGFHSRTADLAFYREAPCFRALPAGRVYPPPRRVA